MEQQEEKGRMGVCDSCQANQKSEDDLAKVFGGWTARVISHSNIGGDGVVFYMIAVENTTEGKWTVEKRYTQFEQLFVALRHRCDSPEIKQFPFPRKDLFFEDHSKSAETRQILFDKLCQIMVQLQPIPPYVIQFLRPPKTQMIPKKLETPEPVVGCVESPSPPTPKAALAVSAKEDKVPSMLQVGLEAQILGPEHVQHAEKRHDSASVSPAPVSWPITKLQPFKLSKPTVVEECQAPVVDERQEKAKVIQGAWRRYKILTRFSGCVHAVKAVIKIQALFRKRKEQRRFGSRRRAKKIGVNADEICKQLLVANKDKLYNIFLNYMEQAEPVIKRAKALLFGVHFSIVPTYVSRHKMDNLINDLVKVHNDNPDEEEIIDLEDAPLNFLAFLSLLVFIPNFASADEIDTKKFSETKMGENLNRLFQSMDRSEGKHKMGGTMQRNTYDMGAMDYIGSSKLPSVEIANSFDFIDWLHRKHFQGKVRSRRIQHQLNVRTQTLRPRRVGSSGSMEGTPKSTRSRSGSGGFTDSPSEEKASRAGSIGSAGSPAKQK